MESVLSLYYGKLNRISFLQDTSLPVTDDRAAVNVNVFSLPAGNEAAAFISVVPPYDPDLSLRHQNTSVRQAPEIISAIIIVMIFGTRGFFLYSFMVAGQKMDAILS